MDVEKKVAITEARAKLAALIDEVQHSDEIIITRHGVPVARLRAAGGPFALKGLFAGQVRSNVPDEELFSTGDVSRLP